jgi:pimeloyl-ACP methyl ester carboxylesterase
MNEIRRGFADIPGGQIHYRTAGSGPTVLMLHQTPRSSDEFLDVIPAFAKHFRVIATDTIGYGDSYRPLDKSTRIADFANSAVQLLDYLEIGRAHVVGHHTGSVIAMELAAAHPDRVDKLVLSAAPYVDEKRREAMRTRPPVDKVDTKSDGSHLTEMWQLRMTFYPKNRPDLLARYVVDALKAKGNIEVGHQAVEECDVPEMLSRIHAPTLALCGTDDPFCYSDLGKIAGAIPGCEVKELPGGMVPIVDQMPEEFSRIVIEFLLR